jgi:hypothetical protein
VVSGRQVKIQPQCRHTLELTGQGKCCYCGTYVYPNHTMSGGGRMRVEFCGWCCWHMTCTTKISGSPTYHSLIVTDTHPLLPTRISLTLQEVLQPSSADHPPSNQSEVTLDMLLNGCLGLSPETSDAVQQLEIGWK